MKLMVDNNPNEILDLKEDKWAYIHAGLVLGLIGFAAGIIILTIFF